MPRHIIGIMLTEFFDQIVELRFVGLFLLSGERTFDHDAATLPHESSQRFTVGCL